VIKVKKIVQTAGITGIFIMQKAEADRFLSALQDVDTIRKKEKKQ
jgi:hypothetical protein